VTSAVETRVARTGTDNDGVERWSLYTGSARVAELAVRRQGEKPPVFQLELLVAGWFRAGEVATFLAGLEELKAKLPELMNLKPTDAAEPRHIDKEIDMAKAKKTTKAKGKTVAKKTGEAKAPRETAAGMFRELILKGGQTDDQIFAAVQKKFSLGDEKRSYVAWYRNQLKKDGKNPPAAKE
jgi:hypothetical protein